MSKPIRWALTICWVLIAIVILGFWDLARDQVLGALLPSSYSSENEARAVAAKYAIVITAIKYAILVGPIYLIWTDRKSAPSASPLLLKYTHQTIDQQTWKRQHKRAWLYWFACAAFLGVTAPVAVTVSLKIDNSIFHTLAIVLTMASVAMPFWLIWLIGDWVENRVRRMRQ